MASKILMLRHGITEGNKNKWFYGGLDLPLIPEGRDALLNQKTAGWYPEVPDNAQFFTTGMLRTEETLEVLFGEREHKAITDLREMEFGEYEARTFDELRDDPAFQSWTYDETGEIRFPGGESRNDFATRIRRGMKELLDSHRLKELEVRHNGLDAFTVLVCHGGVLSSIMYELFPDEREDMWQWMPEPGGGYLVEMDERGPKNHQQLGEIVEYYTEEDER